MRISDAHPSGCGVFEVTSSFFAGFFLKGGLLFTAHWKADRWKNDTLGFAEDVSLYLRCWEWTWTSEWDQLQNTMGIHLKSTKTARWACSFLDVDFDYASMRISAVSQPGRSAISWRKIWPFGYLFVLGLFHPALNVFPLASFTGPPKINIHRLDFSCWVDFRWSNVRSFRAGCI